jgi:DHA3 family macrolide efflux protein-like MFS transporter
MEASPAMPAAEGAAGDPVAIGTGGAAPPAPATAAAAPGPASPPAGRLWNRNFFLLWQGQTVSRLGDQAFSVAMMFWLMKTTGSASLMGLLMTVSSIPGVLLTPFGGTFADRHSRVRILVVCDLLSGVGTLGLAALMFFSKAQPVLLAGLFAVALLGGIVRAFFMPAISAAIPDLVPPESLAAANSANQFTVQTSMLAGLGVGGVLFRLLGAPLLFVADGLSFLFAAASEALVRTPPMPRRPPAPAGQVLRAFLGDTREGFRWIAGQKGLRDFVLIAAILNFFATPTLVLFPFYVSGFLHAGADWYGFLLAAVSAGSIAGYLAAGALKLNGAARGRALIAGLVVGPFLFGILGYVTVKLAALVVIFLAGFTFGLVNIYLVTMLQLATPSELRGRVMGLLATLGGALMPIGMAISGVVGDLTGKNIPVIYAACAVLQIATTLSLANRKECRAFLSQG